MTDYHEIAMEGLFSHPSDPAAEESPFRPGSGTLPPYLAGRQAEQSLVRRFLKVLARRDAPTSEIILYGPRGNGKTALLLWARHEAQSLGIDVLRFSGRVVRSTESLARRISPEPRFLRWLGGVSLTGVGGVTLKDPERQVADVLARRARRRPMLLAVDEAHMLAPEPGAVLLNEVQDLRGEDLPVLLILAGTPDLPRHLRAMGASFWVRSKRLPIGRLDPDAAAAAIRVPLQERGRSIEDEALRQVVSESHGYPFFLQLWGDLLWTKCAGPAVHVSLADVNRARPLFKQGRECLYDELLDELKAAELVSVAARVAAEFTASQQVLRERVTMAIRSSLREQRRNSDRRATLEVEGVLRCQGFIWPVVTQQVGYYEPGIPSLMRHVALNESRNREVRGGSS